MAAQRRQHGLKEFIAYKSNQSDSDPLNVEPNENMPLDSMDFNDDTYTLRKKLADWYLKNNPSEECMEDLLSILNSEGLDVPLLVSQLLDSISTTVDSSQCVHIEMDNSFQLPSTNVDEKLKKLEKQMDVVLSNQSKMLAILQQISKKDEAVDAEVYFPIADGEQLKEVDRDMATNKNKYIPIMRQILQPAGQRQSLSKNFHRLFGKEILIKYNYDGVNNKDSFKQFKNVNKALFDIVNRNGYTDKEYISEVRNGFRTFKGRYFKKQYDDRKRSMNNDNLANKEDENDPILEN